MRNNGFVWLSILILSSCATTPVSKVKSVPNFRTIESLPLGTSIDQTIKVLGLPTLRQSDRGGDSLNYEYENGDGQAVALGFDASGKLYTKGYRVRSVDPESNLTSLIKIKFKNAKFEKIHQPLCGRDYMLPPTYVNGNLGVTIDTYESGEVDYVFWSQPAEFAKIIVTLKSCPTDNSSTK